MFAKTIALALVALLSIASAKTYFKEDFNDKDWKSRWTVPSDWKPKVREARWSCASGFSCL